MRMRLWHHLILIGFVRLGFLAGQFGHRQSTANQAAQAGATPEPAGSQTPEARKAAEALRTAQEDAEARETRAYIDQLKKLEGERGQSLQAAEASDQARATVRSKREEAWSALIQTNMPAYQVLRKAAIDADDRSAHCTLCDGHGLMKFCVLCNGDGQCPTCGGTGKSFGSQLCAACLGSGKCFIDRKSTRLN